MNKHILLIISLAFITGLVLSACQSGGSEGGSPLNTLTAEEKEQGFVLLFDGKTFDGWRGYHKEAFPEQGWIIEDGALKCVGSGEGEAGGGGGDIIYEKRFKDFHLKLEWKISFAGNSFPFASTGANAARISSGDLFSPYRSNGFYASRATIWPQKQK